VREPDYKDFQLSEDEYNIYKEKYDSYQTKIGIVGLTILPVIAIVYFFINAIIGFYFKSATFTDIFVAIFISLFISFLRL